ncbi:maltokinase N-terminal cap-like domain-containing protein [Kineococcus sp. SYSU DK003]|uniref:maltokinase N-terminal cap-like domain-containing protein n=1 Tax=Kineococcus sp. SYSU DK003 TaxID=3383124 RepID=UPI003D7DAEA7
MSAPVRTSVASDEAIAELLRGWAPAQRWFAHKGVAAHVVRLERTPLDEGGVAQLVALTVRSGEGEDAARTVYSVPITVRPAPDEALAAALIGELPDVDGSPAWIYDGPHDPTWTRALLTLVASEEGAGSTTFGVHGHSAEGGLPVPAGARTKVLSGEQSNTSIVVTAEDGETPLIAKVFRVLSAGDNPDVVVQTALADAGCGRVPRPAGWVDGQWTGPDGELAVGHLAHVTEFLAGSQDAWRVATAAVEQHRDFSGEARELGRATAEVHAVLAAELPTEPATPQRLSALADGLLERVAWACTAVPQLHEVAAAARERVDAVRHVGDAPALQRVHGDYHLGQVLHSQTRGWVLLDFEGEPLRPLAERSVPDLALRDVAGMLRSFDYAASTVADPGDWGPVCRQAFLDGYTAVAGTDPRVGGQAVLLAALELDKALYEVVYEARNRPDWLRIPLDAVHRLLAADPS